MSIRPGHDRPNADKTRTLPEDSTPVQLPKEPSIARKSKAPAQKGFMGPPAVPNGSFISKRKRSLGETDEPGKKMRSKAEASEAEERAVEVPDEGAIVIGDD